MYLARVLGSVVATIKVEGMEGVPLLVVQGEGSDGRKNGASLVAADSTGQAGPGDLVFMVDGREAGFPLPVDTVPADMTIVGIVDRIDRVLAGESLLSQEVRL